MAQKTQIILIDDVDGSSANETVRFALDGVNYEIDLSGANAAKLRDDLALWIGHARRAGGRRAPARRNASGPSATEIRAWATENGIEVNSHGRVPFDVREAYEKAHK